MTAAAVTTFAEPMNPLWTASRGLSPRALSEFVQRGLSTQRVRAACVECNRDQLHLLSAELANDHGYLVDHVPLEELSAVHPPDALRRADVPVTASMRGYRQADPARQLPNLKKMPILIVTAEASYHAPYDHCTVNYLRQAGVAPHWLKLADHGISGNSHVLMMEKNSKAIADLIIAWANKTVA